MTRFVIENMDDALIRDLASLAAANGLPVDVQARDVLRRNVPVRDRAKLAERLDAIAALTPNNGVQTDSVILLREDRRR